MERVCCLYWSVHIVVTANIQLCRLCDVFVGDHGCELDDTPVVESVVGEVERFQMWEESELDLVDEFEKSLVLNAIASLSNPIASTDQRELFEARAVVVVDHGGEVEHSLGADAIVGEIEHAQVGKEEALVAEACKQVENAFRANPVV